MSHLVSQTIGVPRETLSTNFTFEWLLIAVALLVVEECRLLPKSLGADLTPERFLPGVDQRVSLKNPKRSKTLVTYIAKKYFLPWCSHLSVMPVSRHTFQIPYCIIKEYYQ